MSNNFCSYVDEAHDLKLRMSNPDSDSYEDDGGVEDMLSAPYFGSDVRPLPPTFGDPEVGEDGEEQKQQYQSVAEAAGTQ